MITILRSGMYRLIETKHQTKVLYLGADAYAWVRSAHIGELLVTTHNFHKTDCVLSVGRYRLYTVEQVPKLSDNPHLELEVGKGCWQGYLLLNGLPDDRKKRRRIIPTHEIITGNRQFEVKKARSNVTAV